MRAKHEPLSSNVPNAFTLSEAEDPDTAHPPHTAQTFQPKTPSAVSRGSTRPLLH
jgi:hypothetical protein